MTRSAIRGFDIQAFLDDRIGLRHVADGGSGREIVADCPWCGGSRKLWVNRGTGLWICYKCGENGDAVAIVAQLDGLSRTAARQWMVAEASDAPGRSVESMRHAMDDLAPTQADRPAGPDPDLVKLPPEFIPIWDPIGRTWHVPNYVRARGIRLRTAAAFGIGYCEGGAYHNRMVMPVTMNGRLVSFQARAMAKGMIPKYMAPLGGDKTGSLYGYDQAALADQVVIVEGPTDVLAVVQAGFPAIGLTGKMISLGQIAAITRAGYSRVIVMLDPDAAGFDGRAARAIADHVETLITRLPAGVDPGSATHDVLVQAISAARSPRIRDRARY